MPSPANSDTAAINAKNLKVMPASLLKQFRATASMRCYDFLFVEDTMKKVDLWKKGYRLFHGNKDLNIISQVNLLVRGHGHYARIYDIGVNVVTDRNTACIDDATIVEPSSSSTNKLVVKEYFNPINNGCHYTAGVHFNSDTVSASSKSSTDKCAGRSIIELGKIVLKNVKKAVVIAEEWLNNGELPSGKTWDDLYAHIIVVHEEKMFIGFMAFVCMTK